MNAKRFIKSVVSLFVIVVGVLYVASAFLISERIGAIVDFSEKEPVKMQMEPVQFQVSIDHGAAQEKSEVDNAVKATVSQPVNVAFDHGYSGSWYFWKILSACIKWLFLGLFLAVPVAMFYVFLVRPMKGIPVVEPSVIRSLDDDDLDVRRWAGSTVGRAMWSAGGCSKEDEDALRRALERPSEIDKVIKDILSSRKVRAEQKAIEIAVMAGLTMSISSLSMGDGLGMLFWKSKLVYETFRIYGFRPSLRTTLSIWAHVVFAAFFAASIDELCELLDVSDIIGGLGVRLVQGIAGAAIVIKGGQLTRTYLMQGVSATARKNALAEFRESGPNVFREIVNTLKEHGVYVDLNLVKSNSVEPNMEA